MFGIDNKEFAKGLRIELSKRRLLDFGALTYPGWQAPKHVVYLADLLEKVEQGKVKKLAISLPPGSGKSTITNIFIPWCLGRDPARRFLAVSASERLARRNSWAMREIVQAEEWPWPEVTLVGESLEEWQTTRGGGVRAIGRTGTVTGFRAEGIFVDDAQADYGSPLTRQGDEEWFRGVLTTRLEPTGFIVFSATRWGDDDLIGRVTEGEGGEEWHVVNIPALALEEDKLGRQPGEALWPERFSVEALDKIRFSVGPMNFESQYQGSPVPVGGAIFKAEWFENRYEFLPRECHLEQVQHRRDQFDEILMGPVPQRPHDPMPLIKIQACDSAWKEGTRNDWSWIVTLASDLLDIYVVDAWYNQVDYVDLVRNVKAQYEKHQPRAFYIEEAASGFAVVSELKRATNIPIIGVKAGNDSKEAKAETITGWLEAGRIKFPKHASWMQRMLQECLRFPAGKHDDAVDALRIGVQRMIETIARIRGERKINRQFAGITSFMGR